MRTDKLKVRPTNRVRTNDIKAFKPIDIEVQKTGNISEFSLDRNEEYEMSATVSIKFWANSAQYNTARNIAQRTLLAQLFGPVYAKLHEARLAISDGDQIRALRVIDDIAEEVGSS